MSVLLVSPEGEPSNFMHNYFLVFLQKTGDCGCYPGVTESGMGQQRFYEATIILLGAL